MIEVAPEVLGQWIFGLVTMFSLYLSGSAMSAILALVSWLGNLQPEKRFLLFMSGMLLALALLCAALFAGTVTLVAPLMTDVQRFGGGCITIIFTALCVSLASCCIRTRRQNRASA